MSDDLIRMDAVDLIDGYRQGRFSPVDATAAVLARIHAVNDKINAFMIIDDEGAMAAARESEARWSKGAPKGLIDGVPTTIKDLMLTKGWPTLKGSLTVDPAGPWDEDAPCVARLREHGAVLLGKTTTPEVGWKGITDSALSGITRNPWNLAKTPGGSSGGASAALAANMGPLAVGSDGGGSIRIPSGFAGVFGLKPNYGRVPVYPESAMRNLSHIGPMTRSVADAALMLNVLAEPDYRDPTALPYQAIDFTKGLDDGIAGLKIAFSPDLGYANVDPEVAGIVAEAVTAFTELGATVERRDPGFDNPKAAFRTLWWAGAAGAFAHMPDAQKAKLEPELAQIVAEGQELSAMDYMRALEGRTDLCMRLRAFSRMWICC